MANDFVVKNGKKLRSGYTTGTCACAAAMAATIMHFEREDIKEVKVRDFTLDIGDIKKEENSISCSVTKDAGDDPDVTHGIKIFASSTKIDSGIVIQGGEGVGVVTRKGLKVPIGHAAINPVPYKNIKDEVENICAQYDYHGGIKIIISVPDGREIAKKTMNERLGIVGGISILGTTGRVEPMSEKAIVDTIKTEMDMRISEGKRDLFINFGNYGRDFSEKYLGLNINSAIKCSNFIGETLDYAVYLNVERILLIGHAGKMVKLAGGIMNTHSSVADCRMEIIAAHCGIIGANKEIIKKIMNCVTTDEALLILKEHGIDKEVWKSIGDKIWYHLKERTKGKITMDFVVFTEEFGVLASSRELKYIGGFR